MAAAQKMVVGETEVSVLRIRDDDYISLTDMLKAKDGEFFFSNWLRKRNTIEFLGVWEKVNNPAFNCAEFDIIKLQDPHGCHQAQSHSLPGYAPPGRACLCR